MSTKPLVIYHDNCADGFGAAFAAWLKLGEAAEYLPMQYGKIKDELDFERVLQDINFEGNPTKVYILDFSFPRQVMDFLFDHRARVVWLDHHKTAFEAYGLTPNKPGEPAVGVFGVLECLESKHFVYLDNNKSGAMLAWEYFHPDKDVPILIKHIDDYDRWQFKIERTKELIKALWSYAPWSFDQWRRHFFAGTREREGSDEITDKVRLLYNEGEAILRAHAANVVAVVDNSSMLCVISLPYMQADSVEWRVAGLAANCPSHLASDVGHQLANQSGTYGLLWHIDRDGKCQCSLRSNGDYDVSAIAKVFGGGGHKNAAGFSVPIATLLGWIA